MWEDFTSSVGEQVLGALLVIAILAFQIRYGVIKPEDVRANEWAVAWPYILLIVGFLVFHLARAPKKLDDEREAKAVGLKRNIEQLTEQLEKAKCPTDRPMLAFNCWGQRHANFLPETAVAAMRDTPHDISPLLLEHGFYLTNDGGGTALEITLETFQVGAQLVALSETLARIEKNNRGFVPVWIKDASPRVKWGLDMALEAAWKLQVNESGDVWQDKPIEIPVSVVYRDYNNLWYRSCSTLCYTADLFYPNHITFTAPTQEPLGLARPESVRYIRDSQKEEPLHRVAR